MDHATAGHDTVGPFQRRIPHTYHVDAVHRDIVLLNQIPNHRVRQPLRTLNAGLTFCAGVPLHFDQIATLAL